jgi:hypothetical protein
MVPSSGQVICCAVGRIPVRGTRTCATGFSSRGNLERADLSVETRNSRIAARKFPLERTLKLHGAVAGKIFFYPNMVLPKRKIHGMSQESRNISERRLRRLPPKVALGQPASPRPESGRYCSENSCLLGGASGAAWSIASGLVFDQKLGHGLMIVLLYGCRKEDAVLSRCRGLGEASRTDLSTSSG